MLELGDFILLNSHGTFDEVSWFRRWSKGVGTFIMRKKNSSRKRKPFTVCAHLPSTCGSCYQSRWPRGELKEDESRKQGTRRTSQDGIYLIFPGSFFLFPPFALCLFQSENQLPFFRTFYSFTSKLNEHINSPFIGLQMVSKINAHLQRQKC